MGLHGIGWEREGKSRSMMTCIGEYRNVKGEIGVRNENQLMIVPGKDQLNRKVLLTYSLQFVKVSKTLFLAESVID